MRRHLLIMVVLGSAVVMASAACGESSGEAGGSAPPAASGTTAGGGGSPSKDGCGLVTREEAASAAGNPVKPGKMLGVVCIWEPEGDDPEHLQVSVAWVPVPSGTDVGQVCEAGLPGIPNAKPFPDAGLGNSAYWDYSTAALANSGSLHVCADGGILDTAAIGARPEAELKEIAVSLARTALSRV